MRSVSYLWSITSYSGKTQQLVTHRHYFPTLFSGSHRSFFTRIDHCLYNSKARGDPSDSDQHYDSHLTVSHQASGGKSYCVLTITPPLLLSFPEKKPVTNSYGPTGKRPE